MPPVIEVSHLTKLFHGATAVDNISFQVERGELLGFLGPNGAGKTTTIAMLLGIITLTRGRIRLLGLDMPRERREVLARVNFSSPYVALPYDLTVWENLMVYAHLHSVREPRRAIRRLSEVFGAGHPLNQRTGRLSSGEIARVNLVKAFLNDPEILFLDEPTASLDPEAAHTVRSLLVRLQREQNLTIFYTSHNADHFPASRPDCCRWTCAGHQCGISH